MAKTVNNVKINTTFATAASREQLTSGENLCTSLGKINKYLADLDTGAFTFPANGGNADTFAENSIDKFLKYNGIATDCNKCTTRGVYQVDKSTLNIPDAVISPLYTPILFVVNETCQLFFTGTEIYKRSGISLNGGYPDWKSWTNVADNGNASTVEGKSLSDLMVWGMSYDERTKITSGNLDDYTKVGSYVVTTADVAATITNSPWTKTGYFLDVYYRTTGYCVQIAMTWDGYIKIRALNGNTWYQWRDIVHSNYIASSKSAGIVTTGTQHFAGIKYFDDDIFMMHSGVTTGGEIPSTTSYKSIVFPSSAGNVATDMARISSIVRSTTGNNEVVLQMRDLSSGTSRTMLSSKVNATGSNYYTTVANPVQATTSALRNLSSGSATPQTKDSSAAGYVSSGSWYGKHD